MLQLMQIFSGIELIYINLFKTILNRKSLNVRGRGILAVHRVQCTVYCVRCTEGCHAEPAGG
ncbi:MAG: hypothetical protein PWR03_2015 [Tenuifilum sp.]|jgi:hypothetical protein|nr:hypothetical protein [Tenuifilum sp.]